MNQLKRYMEDTGRSAEEIAVDLSALLGKKIGPGGVRLHASRANAPQAWADALDLPAPAQDDGSVFLTGEYEEPDGGLLRDEQQPPTPPPGAEVRKPPPGGPLYATAKSRLTMAYSAVGGGLSMATRNPAYGPVFDNYAPELAAAWVKAAEADPNVARIVRFLESGGPVGELIVGHVILAGAILYVNGKGPDALDAVYGKFSGFRIAAAARATAAEADAHLNGSGADAAADFMGQSAS